MVNALFFACVFIFCVNFSGTSCEPGRFQTAEYVYGRKDDFQFNDGNDYAGLGGLASDCQVSFIVQTDQHDC